MSDPDTRTRELPPELRAALYQGLAARRLGYDTLMWQAPALALTAQAFLLTIALGPGSSRTARLISAALSFVLAAISAQLLMKHRFNESIDSRLLERLERQFGLDIPLGGAPHIADRARGELAGVGGNWFTRRSSYRIWLAALAVFAVAAAVVLVLTLVSPSALAASS